MKDLKKSRKPDKFKQPELLKLSCRAGVEVAMVTIDENPISSSVDDEISRVATAEALRRSWLKNLFQDRILYEKHSFDLSKFLLFTENKSREKKESEVRL